MDPSLIVGLIVIAVVLWFVLRGKPPAIFVIRLQDGEAVATSGKVTEAFIQEVTHQCQAEKVRVGEIRGVPWGSQIRLRFSAEFPAEVQQRLRNWWVTNGWRGGPKEPDPSSRTKARRY